MSTQQLLDQIINEAMITVLFQPIINLKTAEVVGYEALSRGPSGTDLNSPVELISTAEHFGRLCELEQMLKEKTLERASALSLDKLLFLNMESAVVSSDGFTGWMTLSFIQRHGISSNSVVIELTERLGGMAGSRFQQDAMRCRDTGLELACSSGSDGFSYFFNTSHVFPKYLKINRNLVSNIHEDMTKKSVVKAFVSLANTRNIKLIAEGIETPEELVALVKLGVYAGQGYFLARPAETPSPVNVQVRDIIMRCARQLRNSHARTQHIGSICEAVPALDEQATCLEVKKVLDDHQHEGVCLLSGNNISGLMMRYRLDSRLSNPEAYAAHAGQPVKTVMDEHCIVVDYYTSVRDVADLVLTRPRENIYDNVIVTKDCIYFGMVTMIDLLKFSMEIQYKSAMNCNPLTQLPGNNQINDKLSEIIQTGVSSCILYLDLNHFKAYNDVYGFGRGDSLILMTRNVVCSVIDACGADSFVGHIGGDDFMICVRCGIEACEQLCDKIIQKFNRGVMDYYNEEDRKRGYITSESRTHKLRTYPLMQVSIGGLCGQFDRFSRPEELAQYIGKHKKAAKGYDSSAYVIEDLKTGRIYYNQL